MDTKSKISNKPATFKEEMSEDAAVSNDGSDVEVDEFGRMLRRNSHRSPSTSSNESRRSYSSSRASRRNRLYRSRSRDDNRYRHRRRRSRSPDRFYDEGKGRRSSYNNYGHGRTRKYSDSEGEERCVGRRRTRRSRSVSRVRSRRESKSRSESRSSRSKSRGRSRSRSKGGSRSGSGSRHKGRIRSESGSRDRSAGHETGREREELRYGRGLDGSYDPYVAASQYIDTEFCTRKIYVGDLRQVSQSALHNAFSQFGEITSLNLFEDKGYAFIDYATTEQAAEARRKMNGAHLGGGSILVNRAKRPERNVTGFGNVPWSDADGNQAKLNDITSPRDIEFKAAPADPSLQLPKRRIIAYDDL